MIESFAADELRRARDGGALAGGASSAVRAGAAVGGAPFLQAWGRGAYAYDPQGRAYIDYLMAYGPLLSGTRTPRSRAISTRWPRAEPSSARRTRKRSGWRSASEHIFRRWNGCASSTPAQKR